MLCLTTGSNILINTSQKEGETTCNTSYVRFADKMSFFTVSQASKLIPKAYIR